MIIYDPLYGTFRVDTRLRELLNTPEVRRLSQIRLLNTSTPSLATLGELRRFSHSLGVLRLCMENPLIGYDREERSALEACVLIHDLGTPPFGHLFEYHLRDRSDWHHEAEIWNILSGTHAPENTAHQIFYGKTIRFRELCKSLGYDVELIHRIVARAHPLSQLLFGSLDFDNLDNVARMGWALGLQSGPSLALRLASRLSVSEEGDLLLNESADATSVVEWMALRKRIYEVLVFDSPTVAAQAILSRAIEIALEERLLGDSPDPWVHDEQLLDQLRENNITRDMIQNEYFGRLPKLLFCLQYRGGIGDLGFDSRVDAVRCLENLDSDKKVKSSLLGYVFIDSGSFSKRLTFRDPTDDHSWTIGEKSVSSVFYLFQRKGGDISYNQCRTLLDSFISREKLDQKAIIRQITGVNQKDESSQLVFDLKA